MTCYHVVLLSFFQTYKFFKIPNYNKAIDLCVLQTISVLEPNKLVDTELLGLYAMLMAAIGAAGKRMLK